MLMDQTVTKYRHCGRVIYSFSCPSTIFSQRNGDFNTSKCPICRQILTFGLLDAPVALPCPFVNGHKVSCAFVIGSIHGPSHLGEWHDTEIHVGLSNSEGQVYNYTLSGVQRDDHGWEHCVCVQLIPPRRHDLRDSWDKELEKFSVLPQWVSERFHEEREFGSCCYGFALTFINHMRSLDSAVPLSRGIVYNYTRTGVHRDHHGWECCISIPLVQPDMFNLISQWDQYLEKFSSAQMWDPMWQSFNEENHNCYTYSLMFINCVLATQSKRALTKDEFTHTFVLPRIKTATKYMMLCREISQNHFYIVSSPQTNSQEGQSVENQNKFSSS